MRRMTLRAYEATVESPDFSSRGEIWTLESYCNDRVVVSVEVEA
jgi:hypothetical protein